MAGWKRQEAGEREGSQKEEMEIQVRGRQDSRKRGMEVKMCLSTGDEGIEMEW